MQGKYKALVQNILNLAPKVTPMSSIYPIMEKLRLEVKGLTRKNSGLIEQENTLTALIALGYVGNERLLFNILTENESIPIESVMITEAQPKTLRPKKESIDFYEGNSHIDIAIGDISRRMKKNGDRSINGIEYSGALGGAVCFVEAKLESDISCYSGSCIYRNQIVRIIENLALLNKIDSIGDAKYPKHLHFTLMTPECFRNKPRIRLYSYLYDQYSSERGAELLFEDIRNPYPSADKISQYSDEIEVRNGLLMKRLEALKLHWITHEEVIESIPNTRYKEAIEDLINEVSGPIVIDKA